ncbi:MAG TPA: hypothetical protein VLD19_15410 [Chitinophagaceae bacterium]|nr:hypothetical protein [Chitinophagaceae bacterium]
MQRYKNISGDSGVVAYETGDDYIKVRFIDGVVYLYTNAVTGQHHISQMKKLAAKGLGLSAYISRHVRSRYAEKSG